MGEMLSADDYQRMAGWKANVVRIALNQQFCLKNGSCDANYDSQAIQFADQNNVSWTAWAWYVNGCTFSSLITTWNGGSERRGAGRQGSAGVIPVQQS